MHKVIANVLIALGLLAALAPGQEVYPRGRVAPQHVIPPDQVQPAQPAPGKYPRGRVAPPNLPAIFQASEAHSAGVFRALPPATEPAWDSRQKGWVGPVKNQASCGSCWDFAGVGIVEIAAAKAGVGKAGEFVLSEQYILDCVASGGCNGDDHSTVLAHAKKTGLAFHKDYGPYRAREGPCKSAGMKLFQLPDWGFADGDRGYEKMADTQLIKNAIKAYGAVSVAVAATSTWDGYRGGVHTGNSRQIDHEVILVGWQDDAQVPGGGYWLMRNSWGENWGEAGYMRIGYKSDSVGTEAVFAIIPEQPVPVPPVPPEPASPFPWLLLVAAFLAGGVIVAVVVLVVRKRA